MPSQEQQKQEQSSSGKQGEDAKNSTLPKAMQKRVSLKWLTVEALANVIERLEHSGQRPKAVFYTAGGQIEGRLCELKNSYAEAFTKEQDHLLPDVASMVTHVRSELLRSYEKEEQELKIVDTAPILSLREVVITNGQGVQTSLPQLTLFADQVIGFSLTPMPELH